MRRLALNLFTSAITLALLAALTVPALRVLDPRTPARAATRYVIPARTFGVYVDPWHVDDWARRIGARPQLVAKFEAFARKRTIGSFLAENERQGIRQVMVSWEPWEPVPAALGTTLQQLPQPGYRNSDIAAGSQDAYIRAFARSLASFDGTVWLRYAHEMNGFWYPWSADAPAYVRAWRHMVRVVRAAGARNVRFVWSANPNLYERPAVWLRNLRRYWPGAAYVDVLGSTMINFGGLKDYTVARFAPRLALLHQTFGLPVLLTEVNTERTGSAGWLDDLGSMLRHRRWLTGFAWSQLPSRGAVQRKGTVGNLNWDVTADPAAAAALRGIARDDLR
jgi:mannan endo-1,4-beta-mannosidase